MLDPHFNLCTKAEQVRLAVQMQPVHPNSSKSPVHVPLRQSPADGLQKVRVSTNGCKSIERFALRFNEPDKIKGSRNGARMFGASISKPNCWHFGRSCQLLQGAVTLAHCGDSHLLVHQGVCLSRAEVHGCPMQLLLSHRRDFRDPGRGLCQRLLVWLLHLCNHRCHPTVAHFQRL